MQEESINTLQSVFEELQMRGLEDQIWVIRNIE